MTVPEPRFFVSPEDVRAGAAADVGMVALIRGTEHHHLSRVLRMREGEAVCMFDGDGRGFRGIIQSIAKEDSCVRITGPDDRAVEPSFRLILAQGIPRHDRMEVVIQKATELGVARIVPVIAERSLVKAKSAHEWNRVVRWRRVAREAARQSGRLRVPPVDDPVPWDEFIEAPGGSPAHVDFVLCPEAAIPMSAPGGLGASVTSATVAVGPEGGWSEREVSQAMDRGFGRLVLGPRVLRTETAGIVAVALMLFLAGDLGALPSGRPAP